MPTAKKTPAKKEPGQAAISVAETKPVQMKKLEPVALDEMIDVQSAVFGQLIWISKKTGYQLIWNEFGECIPMSVADLIDMRNGTREFFERNWVVLCGERAQAIMDYLQISKFYKNFRSIQELDEIFTYEPDEISSVIGEMKPDTKENVARRAFALVASGELDSRKVIDAVEKATGFDLSVE